MRHPSDAAPRRRRRQLFALAALAAIGLGTGQMSLALFTDQETVPGTFSTGSIVLDDVKIDALTLTTGTMMPGDTVTDDVVVENDGTAQLRYAMTHGEHEPRCEGPARRSHADRQDGRRDDAWRAVRQLRWHERAGGDRAWRSRRRVR